MYAKMARALGEVCHGGGVALIRFMVVETNDTDYRGLEDDVDEGGRNRILLAVRVVSD